MSTTTTPRVTSIVVSRGDSKPQLPAQSAVVKWLLIFAGSTVIAVFWTWQWSLMYSQVHQQTPWRAVVLLSLIFWYSWALFSPLVVWVGRRFRIERRQLARNLMVNMAASILMAFIHQVIAMVVEYVMSPKQADTPFAFFKLVPSILSDFTFTSDVIIYWMILFANHSLEFYRRYREGELRTSQLQSQLAQAELMALKMQLQPHFLFNTLHAISALVHQDPEAADRMIASLSDMLRLTLHNVGHQEVLLKQELELLEKYLQIEQTRFRDRLKVEFGVDPAVLDAQVPNLILQPLVENAIRHGIAARACAGRIQITAKRHNGMLELQVIDDGPGLPNGNGSAVKEGVGLTNTRARLQQLYGGGQYSFEMANQDKGGLKVSLSIPFQSGSNGA
jgi:two-component system LytT family sensor kinase